MSRNNKEEIQTYILCSVTSSPRKSCRLWGNVEKYGRAGQATDDSIIRRMRIVCWIRKATNTPSEDVLCFSTATVVTRTRYNFTFILGCLYCFFSFGLSTHVLSIRFTSCSHHASSLLSSPYGTY